MRRWVISIVATAMVGSGGYLLYLQATTSTIIFGRFVLAGVFLMGLGAYMLWADVLWPLLRRRGH